VPSTIAKFSNPEVDDSGLNLAVRVLVSGPLESKWRRNMFIETTESRLARIKKSLFSICHDSGIYTGENIEEVYHENLIESGIIDSMAVVFLQDQIETHFKVTISLDQFVGELHTLDKLVNYLAADSAVEILA
jgi:acyl carrier protein